ncbi:MAG: hypothetical protein GYA59_15375 [Chloroflexi bacterium]|nr:hypothetical protein [Chloroflexota bacterium]
MKIPQKDLPHVLASITGPGFSKTDVCKMVTALRAFPLGGFVVEPGCLEICHSCVQPAYIPLIGQVNYPLGLSTTDCACEAIRWCFDQGADQVLIGVPGGFLRSGAQEEMRQYLSRAAAVNPKRPLRVAINAEVLTDDELNLVGDLIPSSGVSSLHVFLDSNLDALARRVAFLKKMVHAGIPVGVDEIRDPALIATIRSLGADFVTVSDPVQLLSSL